MIFLNMIKITLTSIDRKRETGLISSLKRIIVLVACN